MVVRPGHDTDQQVAAAGDGVGFEHFGDRLEHLGHVTNSALSQFEDRERHHGVAHRP
jgi:hypothetical protein